MVFANPGAQSRSLLGDGLAVVNLLLYSGFYLFSKQAREAGWSTLALTRNTFTIALSGRCAGLAAGAGAGTRERSRLGDARGFGAAAR